MRLIKHIGIPLLESKKYQTREASRAVLFDNNGKVPILFVSKYNYHKLPGGGIEGNEDKIVALHREIKEETGCTAKIEREVGKVTEYREKWDLFQISYCYTGKILERGTLELTEKEMSEGFKLMWVSLDDAIKILKNDEPQNYEGGFIQQRDLAFLKETKRLTSEAT